MCARRPVVRLAGAPDRRPREARPPRRAGPGVLPRAASVKAWLRTAGVGEERIAAIRAPAGIDLGAETPEEVALSILAELVQVRRGTASFVASPGPATVAAGQAETEQVAPDEIVLLDPVCGMTVERDDARHLAEHGGRIYAFCSIGCRTRFVHDPLAYLPDAAPTP